jgi:DNA polymerase-3 subunit epsilon
MSYAIVDIETTGGHAKSHRITEVAIYHFDGKSITNCFHSLINPEREIPYFITGLTGINTDMVKAAPTFSNLASEIYDWLRGRVFVAHNAHFDYSFLKKEFEDVGIQWQAKKLCTVRLSRKIIPGLDSYSLGALAESLGINIPDRHRAKGDAQATAKIFGILLKRDKTGAIAKALKRNSGDTSLPPNLDKIEFDHLPDKPGVYYFLDAKGTIIYVGKANNIKKRIISHFSGEAREWNRSNIRNEICNIRFELTGNELIALILESQEIRRLWPKYNLAQKFKVEEWGVFEYEDRNGYLRFSVNVSSKGTQALITFPSKTEAWNFMWEKVKEFDLCPKLSGLQIAKGLCFSHQSGSCKGACQGVEKPKKYNKKVARAIASFFAAGDTAAIIGEGRNEAERSLVLVEKGHYLGFGFYHHEEKIDTIENAKNLIRLSKNNQVVKNIVNSYLLNPRGVEVIAL